MILELTPERRELAKAVRGFLDKHLDELELRRLMATDTAQHAQLWAGLADMNLMSLTVPEEYGGAGYGWSELGVVLEEAGRALLCVPYYSTAVLTTAALLETDDEEVRVDLLPPIVAGKRIATLTLSDDTGSWGVPGIAVRGRCHDGAWTLDGHANYVLDGCAADTILVFARTAPEPDDVSLFIVDGAAPGLSRVPLPTMDLTRKQARLQLRETPARLVGRGNDAAKIVDKVLDIAVTCLAAEQIGGAQHALEEAVEYAKSRYQFGRPIGSFQAVKHICADMLVEVELARSAAYHALWAADESLADLPVAATMAKITCSDAYFNVAAQNIQVHGGVGFTWEHSAHLHLKRAKTGQVLFGSTFEHASILADRIDVAHTRTKQPC